MSALFPKKRRFQRVISRPNEHEFIKNQHELIKNELVLVKNELAFIKNQHELIKNQREFIKNQLKLIKNQREFIKNQRKLIKNQLMFVKNEREFFSILHRMDPNRSFVFESGFPGFPGLRRFRLEWDESLAPLEWLVSVEDPDVRFIVINPMFFKPDYAPRLTKEHMNSISVVKKEDLRILVIVTLKENYEESTANLASPLMFNTCDYKAVQLMLDDGLYSNTEPVFAGGAVC